MVEINTSLVVPYDRCLTEGRLNDDVRIEQLVKFPVI